MWVLALLLLIPVSAKGTEKNSEKQPKSSLGSYHPCDRPSPSSRLLALGQWINMESQYLSLHLSNRRKQASRHMQAAVTCWALCYLHGAVISTFPQLAFWWDSGSELPCSFKKKKKKEKKGIYLLPESKKNDRECPGDINLPFGVTRTSPQLSWPSNTVERLIGCAFSSSSWDALAVS